MGRGRWLRVGRCAVLRSVIAPGAVSLSSARQSVERVIDFLPKQ
jgi:hypothetical protein